MQTNLERFLAGRGILLLVLLSSAGCFSPLKQKNKDAGAPNPDTSALDTSQAGMDAFNGSGGTVVIDASSGAGGAGGVGAGGVLDSGGSLSTGGNSGSGGAVVDASTPDVPLVSDGSDAATTLPNGSRCTADTQCTNGHCVDGVCCDGKCDGTCESCSTGTCSFTSTPRTTCTGSGKCAGYCDKANTKTCTYPGSSTTCSDQSCSAGVRTNKSVCDGKGVCPTATTTSCDTNLCSGSDCSGSCTLTSCGAGMYCAGTTCASIKNQGDSCSTDAECSTNHCVDGYCCESSCTGTCTICSATRGKCTNTTIARVGKSCGGTGTCAGFCGGSSPDCSLPTTSCGQASCSSGVYQPVGSCSSGSCSMPQTQTCPYVCSPSAGCTGNCKPGSAPQCSSSGVPQVCGSDGSWQDQAACTGGKTCSAGSCGCSGSTPRDCNGTCIASLAPACCSSGDCVSGATCQGNKCGCRQKSTTNLLTTPGFDQASSASNWSLSPGASWLGTDDADTCSGSGSIKVQEILPPPTFDFGNFHQCVPVSVGTTYFFGFRYKQDANTSLVCTVGTYLSTDCSGDVLAENITVQGAQVATPLPWTASQPASITPLPGTHTADVRCQINNAGVGYFDQMYLNSAGATF